MGQIARAVVAVQLIERYSGIQVDQIAPPAAHELEHLRFGVHLGLASEQCDRPVGRAERTRDVFEK
jgi:hypothetical protein